MVEMIAIPKPFASFISLSKRCSPLHSSKGKSPTRRCLASTTSMAVDQGRASEWRKMPMALSELCLDTTLRCGQSFRWRKINDEWSVVISLKGKDVPGASDGADSIRMATLRGRILSLQQDDSNVHYKVTWPTPHGLPTPDSCPPADSGETSDDSEELLRRYFSLDLDLRSLYAQWSRADPNFGKRAPAFAGVRILSQDAWETLICFICSSNNNIGRISQMVCATLPCASASYLLSIPATRRSSCAPITGPLLLTSETSLSTIFQPPAC